MFIKMTNDGLPNGNIFVGYPELTQRHKDGKYEKYSQHMSQRYDVKFNDKSKAIRAVELNASETMHTAFNFEFIKNILDNKIRAGIKPIRKTEKPCSFNQSGINGVVTPPIQHTAN